MNNKINNSLSGSYWNNTRTQSYNQKLYFEGFFFIYYLNGILIKYIFISFSVIIQIMTRMCHNVMIFLINKGILISPLVYSQQSEKEENKGHI